MNEKSVTNSIQKLTDSKNTGIDLVLQKMQEQIHRPSIRGDIYTRQAIQGLELTDQQIRRLSQKAMERLRA